MKVWVDADACPVSIKEIIIRAAIKRGIDTVFVANKQLHLPSSKHITLLTVAKSADAADAYILEQAGALDLVITQDIPLAHALVLKGVTTINPRGDKYTEDNIGERLSMRDLMQVLRDSGTITGGAKQFGDKERRAFAALFDREITKLVK